MPQPSRFWRFSYDSDDSINRMIASSSLLAPSSGIRSDKYDPETCIAAKIRIGDGVFLAKLDPDLELGRIVAIGIAQDTKPTTRIAWKRYKRDVHPSPQGGLVAWRERCFLFNARPADRYNLSGDFLQAFPDL